MMNPSLKTALVPGVVAAAMLASLTSVTMLIVRANSDGNFNVEPDYYAKALNWNDTAEQSARNHRLGWSITRLCHDRAWDTLLITVTDSAGAPILDAQVSALVFHHADADDRREINLTHAGGGHYLAPLPNAREGVWELRLVAQREHERFTAKLRERFEPLERTP